MEKIDYLCAMDTKQLMPLLKYYRGEEQNPFGRDDKNAAMWWEGEYSLYEILARNPAYWSVLSAQYKKCLERGGCSGFLADNSVPFEKRAIVFFLDIWHGRSFPYDDLGAIANY